MAQVLVEFADVVTDEAGTKYRAHACGAEMPDGRWEAWLEFLPLDGSAPIRSERETTQPNQKDAAYWATGLTAVYLDGALQRALKPRVSRTHTLGEPVFDAPARTNHAAPTGIPTHDVVLDPFSVYEKGEAHLRRQLGALSAWHLVNIIEAYRLSDEAPATLNRLSAPTLVETILAGVTSERVRR